MTNFQRIQRSTQFQLKQDTLESHITLIQPPRYSGPKKSSAKQNIVSFMQEWNFIQSKLLWIKQTQALSKELCSLA